MSDQATIDRAASELTTLRRAVRAGRRAFAISMDSVFVKAMKKAMELYRQARGQGVSRADALKGLELEVRGAWAKPPSKFAPACGSCDDTGWVEHTCWDRHQCGRRVCANNPERQHLYVDPCGCANGDRMRKRVRTTDDAIAAAGRTQKRKSGNWKQAGA